MATAEFQATAGNVSATASSDSAVTTSLAAPATALTALDTAMADLVTALGTITYSNTTHQFSGTFVSGPSPTAANLNAAVTALNTALADALAAKNAAAAVTADMSLHIGSVANISSMDVFVNCLRSIERVVRGSGLFAQGAPNPRSP